MFVDFGSQNSLPGKNNLTDFGILFQFFFAFFCLLPFSVDLGSFGTQNRLKMSKKRRFWRYGAFSVEKISDFDVFWDHFGTLPARACIVFPGFRFGLDFQAFFVKNVKKAKTEKVAFVL